MKKKFLSIVLFVIFIGNISSAEKLFSISAGISSGTIFYDPLDSEDLNINTLIPNSRKLLLGGLISFNFTPAKEASIFAGADLFADFRWNDFYYANKLSIDIPIGIKVYPNLGGLNIGIAYLIGMRSTYTLLPDSYPANTLTPWGNGFKISFEYNFAHSTEYIFAPSIGCSWKLIPRGSNTWDNQLCAYILINL